MTEAMEKTNIVDEANLEKAKVRLRDALGNLESIVEKKIKNAKEGSDNPQLSLDFSSIQEELAGIKQENNSLRTENSQLQEKVNNEINKIRSMNEVNNKVSQRIDEIVKNINETIEAESI